ncbi:MAG: tRNA (adenosine(37)-N6)-threonylcarbamoyltransferase complex ATPase subunit type 1 TsaE [Pseudomonadota bacterium]|nr:tRNA (adenosine(37)-N6)-threonylcarbamoyltransferase complex ATPase subunit type 1 TsaE [Pseudomonadota bacterium]
MERRFELNNAAATEALGARLAQACPRGSLIFLHGELAAGKTTLARGYIKALGHEGAVKSPTFTLVESYDLGVGTVHHFDLYRITAPEELDYIGIEDYVDGCADCLVEWAEKGTNVLPPGDVEVWLAVVERGRRAVLKGASKRGADVISRNF